ncbi:RagB/SusD family nutrient uptake outer membrane protein [Chryseobacterium antibioticum]|uniref:RagB/SusD family nutrient uptake outer membrane protein n=2 Tax=Chryseobacterium TaxID=59732 RepID=A0A7Y0ALB9_9FLAO|nr:MULTISPECIES: RagB/SusD family nutrient uptake outer membrane protein [Chryseobacterium]MCT2407890.1 RagB/SusD family nutrient uptake outer membrane protein [Chryseobacterium pyrolae]NML69401.1 RagB/SusD family nutrient uptake outer membrane protein [Chryseobacterium antibioticum]
MNKIIKIGLLSIGVAVTSISCSEDFVEREFYQDVQQAPLKTDNEVQAFVRGGYATMRNTEYYGADFLAYGEVRSDEMISNLSGGYYQNVMNYTMLSNDPYAVNTYNRIYELVAKANVVINTDMATIQGTDTDRKNSRYAQGQAYALRAIGFFDGLRLYGQKYISGGESLGIVLPLKYDPTARMPRATIAQTEAQIDADFTKAIELMTANGNALSTNKTELTVYSVKGLMSRFYLYKGDYAKVRSLTNDIFNKYSVASAALLQETFRFTMNGAAPNSIFELAVGINSSLSTGSYRQRLNPNGYANLVVNASTQAAYDANDIRRTFITLSGGQRFLSFSSNANGIGKYTQGVGADNIKMLRYEEILLNGVEAELNGGDPAKALTYYNQILTNRGLAAAVSVDMTKLKLERMKELLGEGIRQWDLRRWGTAVPRPTGASTNVDLNAFPIPRQETDLAGTPVKSNPGYDN